MTDFYNQTREAALLCPACGHENIQGVDACQECSQSLTEEYMAEAAQGEEYGILAERLSVLKPRPPECVSRQTSLSEAITRLKGKNVGCLLVTGDGGKLVGIFTERDVLHRVAGLIEQLENIPVESLMTPNPTSLHPSRAISHALHLMVMHGFRHVPLVDAAERPVGFISFRDVVRFIEESFGRTDPA